MSNKYELKRGVLLQAFGHPDKACTNLTITDELGDWYVKNHPEKLIYFVRYPKTDATPPGIVIIPPTPKVEVITPKVEVIPPAQPEAIIAETLKGIEQPKGRRPSKNRK